MGIRPGRVLVAAAAVLLVVSFAAPVEAATALPSQPGSLGNLSPDQIKELAAEANQRSIILFKDQHPEVPPRPSLISRRAEAVESDQAPVKQELASVRANNVKSFKVVNAVSATISKAEAKRLASDPTVRAVVPDLRRAAPVAESAAAVSPAAVGPAAAALPLDAGGQQICPSNPAAPLLEPEALQVMNVEYQPGDTSPAAHDLVDGGGVKVGIIADGLDPNNPDLIRNGRSIVYDYRDFSGYGLGAVTDGREAFLDAGAIASQGTQSYDLSGFVNPVHALPAGCNIRIKGVAPGASLAVLNVQGSASGFFNSQIIQAIDWAVNQDRVDVLNQSFGSSSFPDMNEDPVQIADNNAVAAGITVVTSTGDGGPSNTIQSPASNPGVIAVGGTTTYRVYRQTTRAGAQLKDGGGWEDNNITALSSAGITQSGPRTVDVVAPGDRGWSLCSADLTHFFGCADLANGNIGQPIWPAGGTSFSAPLTSGTAALVIQAYGKTHNGARPSPDLVKRIIVSTAQDLGAPAEHQGAGLVNALKAVRLAESIVDGNGAPAAQGQSLLVSKSSLVSTVQAGSSLNFNIDVTNAGSSATQLSPSIVSLDPQTVSNDTGTVNLSNGSPAFADERGRAALYETHQFTVGPGADYLSGDILWNAQAQSPQGQPGSVVYETVWDPAGNIAAYSLLGNSTGHGHIEVRKPAPGNWMAAIWTLKNTAVKLGQYRGDVRFSYFTQQFQTAGSVTPAVQTLAPGQTGSLTVTLPASSQSGDRAAALRLSSGGPDDGVVPIVVRSLIALGVGGGSFQGALTGGVSPGQQFTYQFDVPSGQSSLNLALGLRDTHYPVLGYLVDPYGQPLDVQSTAVAQRGTTTIYGNNMQFFRKTPSAGRWTIVFSLDQRLDAIDGQFFTEPFNGSISFDAVPVSSNGLPNADSTVIPQGQTATATIQVTNSGNSSKDFFVDPRLDQLTFQQILSYQATGAGLPLSLAQQPYFYIPPGSDQAYVAAQGTVPVVMDVLAASGQPDILASTLPDNQAIAVFGAPELAPSPWFALPEAQGPFTTGLLGATVDVGALVETNAFDTAVSSSTGNAWQRLAIDNLAPSSPLTLAPGQSGTITVRITPNAATGTVVHGLLGIDTMNPFTSSGDEIVALPYAYTVG